MTERSIDVVPGLVRRHKINGRCVYDAAAKRELVARCLQPGVSVAGMALAHGVNANLLRKWITQRDRARSARGLETLPAMLPVKMRSEPKPTEAPTTESVLELVLPGGTIRMRGAISQASLEMLIDCLTRRP